MLSDEKIQILKSIMPDRVYVAGCGGSGARFMGMMVSYASEVVAWRKLYESDNSNPFISFTLIDPDIVSISNLTRQAFQPYEYEMLKVQALYHRYSHMLNIDPIPEGINNTTLPLIFKDCPSKFAIISALDNAESVTILYNYVKNNFSTEDHSWIWISSGMDFEETSFRPRIRPRETEIQYSLPMVHSFMQGWAGEYKINFVPGVLDPVLSSDDGRPFPPEIINTNILSNIEGLYGLDLSQGTCGRRSSDTIQQSAVGNSIQANHMVQMLSYLTLQGLVIPQLTYSGFLGGEHCPYPYDITELFDTSSDLYNKIQTDAKSFSQEVTE